jgi:hypothetical protein
VNKVKKKQKRGRRIVMEVDDETHTTIKMRCHLKNMSMRAYLLQALAEKIIQEDYDTNDNLYEH